MLTAKLMKTARCMYLFPDSSAVVVHEKRDHDAGTVSWVTLHESIGTLARFGTGRLIVSDKAAIAMVLATISVHVNEASFRHGSENTKKAGIAVSTLTLNFGHGDVYLPMFPELIGCDFTYQENLTGDWASLNALPYRWSDYTISGKYPKKESVTA